jgi:hypothetical protein
MAKDPTAEDAQIIMKLYDLRRETEMRRARQWFAIGFWPRNADDVLELIKAVNPQENAWFRQVSGYWDMAASFVLRGVLNEELFFDSNAELWFVFAKVQPFLKEVRERTQNPMLFQRVEKVATQSEAGLERLQTMLKRVEARRAASKA